MSAERSAAMAGMNRSDAQRDADQDQTQTERRVPVYAGGTVPRMVPESQVRTSTVKYDQDGRELMGQ